MNERIEASQAPQERIEAPQERIRLNALKKRIQRIQKNKTKTSARNETQTTQLETTQLPLSHSKLTKNLWSLYPTWDNSQRSMASQCWRKFYWWARGYGYSPQSKPVYFLFGSAWHEIKQRWYEELQSNSRSSTPADSTTLAIEAFEHGVRFWESEEAIDDLLAPPSPVDSLKNLKALWARYIAECGDNIPFSLIGKAELGWIWPLRDTGFSLGGSVDAFIEHKHFGTIILEEKTTSAYLTDKYIQQWDHSTQVCGYAWMLSQLGHEAKVLLQAAHKRPLGHSAKTPQFISTLIEKTQAQLDSFESDWLMFLQEIELQRKMQIWPKSGATDPRQCVGGLGFSSCPYRGLCASSLPIEEVEPLNFVGLAVREPWKPWDRNEVRRNEKEAKEEKSNE